MVQCARRADSRNGKAARPVSAAANALIVRCTYPQGYKCHFSLNLSNIAAAPRQIPSRFDACSMRAGERSGLEEGRVLAIALGRWTPSPSERAAVAKVFELSPAQIVWGHATPIQHIYGSGPG